MNIILESKISKNGNNYTCLSVDLGYCKKAISFDKDMIAEILNVAVSTIKKLPTNYSKVIGKLEIKSEEINQIK